MEQGVPRSNRLRRTAYAVVFGLLLFAFTLAGIEAIAAAFVPPWPARALRTLEPVISPAVHKMPFAPHPWFAEPYNSWGMRDRERTVSKSPYAFRAAIVGDSFVESVFTPLSLPAAVERAATPVIPNFEAVSLGISGTGPRSYFFRIRDVALALSPDAVVLVFYAGNDFIQEQDGYSAWPRLIDESAGGSLLGWAMPRTNWLVVNRLQLAEIFPKDRIGPSGEEEMIFDTITKVPLDQRVARLAAHLQKYRFPNLPVATIAEILAREDERLFRTATTPTADQEFALPWMFDLLVANTAATYPVPANAEEAARLPEQGVVEATASWLEAMSSVTARQGIPFLALIAPVGTVDPEFVEFWKPWPRYFSWNLVCDERHRRLVALLQKSGIKFVDLRQDLDGVPGTYRKLDAHWTQKGETIVAERIARELAAIRRAN